MLRTTSLLYFFFQFSLSNLSVFKWEHRRHSCVLPFIHQLRSAVPVCSEQELSWVAELLHEASHFIPTLTAGGSSQGWFSPCDTAGKGSVQVAPPGSQGTRSLAGNLILWCWTSSFLVNSLPTFGYQNYLMSAQLEQFV